MNLLFLSLRFRERVRELITDWTIWYSKAEDGYFTNYSWFHLMWIGIMIAACVILCVTLAKKHDKKCDNIVIFTCGSFLIAIEIYKQIFFTIEANHYQWYIFPFQFCSVPMYIAFIAPLLKEGKFKESCYKFLSFYGLLAGLSVMAYPVSCFQTHYVTILIHTMIWHASMVIIGVYLIVSRGYCSNLRNLLKECLGGGFIFVIIVLIALVANIIGYKSFFGTENNTHGDVFWLMYISPYYSCPLPILSSIKETCPYPVFLFCYILAFLIGISLVWFLVYGIRKLISVIIKSTANHKSKIIINK